MDHVQNPLRVAADCFHATLEKGGAAATVESDWGVPLAFWRYLAKEGVSNVKAVTQEGLASGKIEPNTLVRFRGFVQATFNPELYAPVLRLRKTDTKEEKLIPFRYQESFTPEPGVEVVHEGQADRQTFYCLEVPGENDWTAAHTGELDDADDDDNDEVEDIEGGGSKMKRSWEEVGEAAPTSGAGTGGNDDAMEGEGEEEEEAKQPQAASAPTAPLPSTAASSGFTGATFAPGRASTKARQARKQRQRKAKSGKARQSKGKDSGPDSGFDPHVTSLGKFHPQPHEARLACMVQVYDNDAGIKIGDVVEFFGIYTFDPSEGLGAVPNEFLPSDMKYTDPLMAGPGSRTRSDQAAAGAGGDGQGSSKAHRSEALSGTFGSGGAAGWASADPIKAYLAPAFPEHDYMRNPPHSLVPRLHAIVYRKLCSGFPLLQPSPLLKGPFALLPPPGPSEPETAKAETSAPLSQVAEGVLKQLEERYSRSIEEIRQLVCEGLSPYVGGDKFALQYLLMNLISSVEARPYGKPLGPLSVNLMGYPEYEGPVGSSPGPSSGSAPWLREEDPRKACSPYAREVDATLQSILQRSLVIPFAVPYLSSVPLYPVMNYSTERLEAGALQVAQGTHILVDEVVLSEGNLGERGLRNVKALESVTQMQKLPYDFQYSMQEFEVDLPVLTMSTGKGIVPVQANVPLSKEARERLRTSDAPTFGPPTERESYLEMCRVYLAATRLLSVRIPEPVQKLIEEDLVQARRRFPSLTLLAKSYGKSSLDEATWVKVRELESERINRLADIARQRSAQRSTR